jgi:hypothetical protein
MWRRWAMTTTNDADKWSEIDAALSAMPGMDHDTPPTAEVVEYVRDCLRTWRKVGNILPHYVGPEPGGGVIVEFDYGHTVKITFTAYNTGEFEWDFWRDDKIVESKSGTFQSREV